jgi:hypothetical protein
MILGWDKDQWELASSLSGPEIIELMRRVAKLEVQQMIRQTRVICEMVRESQTELVKKDYYTHIIDLLDEMFHNLSESAYISADVR